MLIFAFEVNNKTNESLQETDLILLPQKHQATRFQWGVRITR